MFRWIREFPTRIVEILITGEGTPRLWVLYFSFGAITFGMLSYPSRGAAIVLIPLFLLAGIFGIYGCIISPIRNKTLTAGEKQVNIGMSLMIVASWTRAVLVWGITPNNLGVNILASVVWVWITIGAVFLFIAVSQRGLR